MCFASPHRRQVNGSTLNHSNTAKRRVPLAQGHVTRANISSFSGSSSPPAALRRMPRGLRAVVAMEVLSLVLGCGLLLGPET